MKITNLQSPLMSVIITTKNEERNIANCIESILNSHHSLPITHHSVEIIVVDNNSTDKTKEIIRSFCRCEAKPKQSHIQLYNFGPERSAQRNFGVEKANE